MTELEEAHLSEVYWLRGPVFLSTYVVRRAVNHFGGERFCEHFFTVVSQAVRIVVGLLTEALLIRDPAPKNNARRIWIRVNLGLCPASCRNSFG